MRGRKYITHKLWFWNPSINKSDGEDQIQKTSRDGWVSDWRLSCVSVKSCLTHAIHNISLLSHTHTCLNPCKHFPHVCVTHPSPLLPISHLCAGNMRRQVGGGEGGGEEASEWLTRKKQMSLETLPWIFKAVSFCTSFDVRWCGWFREFLILTSPFFPFFFS